MSTKYELFYVLSSSTSRNSTAGLRPKVYVTTRKDILAAAADECARYGESLEGLAGIPAKYDADGDFVEYEHEMTDEEEFAASVEKLGDDGRLYEIFSTKDSVSAREFIESAKRYGLDDIALDVVIRFGSDATIEKMNNLYFVYVRERNGGIAAIVIKGISDIDDVKNSYYLLGAIFDDKDEAVKHCDSVLAEMVKESRDKILLTDFPGSTEDVFESFQYGKVSMSI